MTSAARSNSLRPVEPISTSSLCNAIMGLVLRVSHALTFLYFDSADHLVKVGHRLLVRRDLHLDEETRRRGAVGISNAGRAVAVHLHRDREPIARNKSDSSVNVQIINSAFPVGPDQLSEVVVDEATVAVQETIRLGLNLQRARSTADLHSALPQLRRVEDARFHVNRHLVQIVVVGQVYGHACFDRDLALRHIPRHLVRLVVVVVVVVVGV